ncbi:MAG: glutamate synthase (NADPH/NADH) small chain [Cyclobacteriaceae bacterium]|jgi:glutamate synthase (NADPH/NADH) small chain
MGQIDGFLKFERELPSSRDPKERINDSQEIYLPFDDKKTQAQAARCMDCGVPFCHSGCPLGNQIPEFNDAVFNEDWEEAFNVLSSTNNFPEFTGRICPAPCETSCVLNINKNPVAIEHIEKSIAEKAYENGWIKPIIADKTGKKVAIVGSGPAGLAAAAQLSKVGHEVTVFERDEVVGGLLRIGIPDFKLEKNVVERRVKVLEEQGVTFKTSINVGVDIKADELLREYDATVLCGGSTVPRDLPIPGRELKGVHFAMEFLGQQNRRVGGREVTIEEIFATNKNVLVIGGGDTGSDCVGTSNRQKAKSITQIELLSKPPSDRTVKNPWPEWPMIIRTSTSHDEGAERDWAILTKEFIGNDKGELTGVKLVNIKWGDSGFAEVEGTERIIPCELVLIAAGFIHPQKEGMLEQLNVEIDNRGNVSATESEYQTSIKSIFTAGDMRRGQSLVVWAISEGREAARQVDEYLMGKSVLESKSASLFELV